MLSRKIMLSSLVSLGLIFCVAAGTAVAEMTHEMPTTQFQPIEQPLAVKGAVTVGGLALIGLELWWFLLARD